ncbi:MAG: FAD-dependent oxidoreductase [Natrialbaceae archaeon]|nr:FAD-dependent oxidoreductase [Natrialbaceae archaeon]
MPFDVVVVGGGPAGATTARQLRQFGHEVCLLEAGTHPREKLCGGLLTRKTARLLERVFATDAETLLESAVIDHRSNRYEAFTGQSQLADQTLDSSFYFAKRPAYDAYLFEQAHLSGATVRTGEPVVQVDHETGTVRTASGRHYSGQYIVGADGATSQVRQCLSEADALTVPGWRDRLADRPSRPTSLDPAHR